MHRYNSWLKKLAFDHLFPPHTQTGLKDLGTVELPTERVRAIQFVPGLNGGVANTSTGRDHALEDPLKCDTVWVGTDAGRLVVYAASDPDRGTELGRTCKLPSGSSCSSLAHHCDALWAGTTSGHLAAFRRDPVSQRMFDMGCFVNLFSEIPCMHY